MGRLVENFKCGLCGDPFHREMERAKRGGYVYVSPRDVGFAIESLRGEDAYKKCSFDAICDDCDKALVLAVVDKAKELRKKRRAA